jgi:hypothetical protein
LIPKKLSHHVERLHSLGTIITNVGRCTREIKSRIAIEKATFKKKKTLFIKKLEFDLRKILVNCCIWSRPLYGAEIWTLRAVNQKYLESIEMWC